MSEGYQYQLHLDYFSSGGLGGVGGAGGPFGAGGGGGTPGFPGGGGDGGAPPGLPGGGGSASSFAPQKAQIVASGALTFLQALHMFSLFFASAGLKHTLHPLYFFLYLSFYKW